MTCHDSDILNRVVGKIVEIDGGEMLDEGERVTYGEQVGPRGRFATEVRRAR